jgi:pyridoxal 5'-phosphate synthase pdxS subunit
MSQNNGNSTSLRLKTGLAEMLKGGVIMDVTNAEQAVIAENAGAVSVMALERVPAQIRAEGGVARMASPISPRRKFCKSLVWITLTNQKF